MKSTIFAAIAALLLSACALSPTDWGNAVRGHAELPALSVAIQECTAERPDVQAELVEPFNVLVDAWHEARDLELNAELLTVLGNARPKLQEVEGAWFRAKSAVTSAGLDCGLWVRSSVQNIEASFTAITDAIEANERTVMVLDYLQVFAAIFNGRQIDVQRMPKL